jgi:hypothetical protein
MIAKRPEGNRIAMKVLEAGRSGLPMAVNPEDWPIPSV